MLERLNVNSAAAAFYIISAFCLISDKKQIMPHKNTSENKPQILVRLENAGVKASDSWRVRHIDLALARGEIITLIGPNGSGKSTTAKMAAGLLRPDEGTVWQMPRLKIGYVPQKLSFDRSLPLNVRRLMRLTENLPDERLRQALAEVGMEHKAEAEVSTLSGGELQRVLLARAAARQPDLLILDEPLQGVDFSWENSLYRWIDEYCHKLNCGILLISHDLHIVMAASHQVICLNGHICCRGKPQDVAKSKEYAGLFGAAGTRAAESPLLAVYEHHHDHRHN